MRDFVLDADIIEGPSGLTLKVPKQFFTREAISMSMYKFTDRFSLSMEPIEEGYVGVSFINKEEQSKESSIEAISAFRNELVDQQARLDLEDRYGSLRDTIVEFAFDPEKKKNLI